MKIFRLPLLVGLVGVLNLGNVFAAPTITATQDDNTPAATRKLVGDTVTYTTTISNTAPVIVGSTANDATGVQLTNPTPANTTEVVGVTISPVAFDDVYPQTVLPNIGINSANIPYSVFTNDFAGTPATTTITAFDSSTTGIGNGGVHGSVSMVTSGANIGQFTYNPPPGFTGTDTFTYTLQNTVGSSVGTVTITVAASPIIWFVNPAVGVTGTGTLSSPFKTVAEAVTAIGTNTGQRIFLYSGSQTTGITLKTNGWLVGQAATGTSFDSVMAISPGSGTIARPTLNSTKPALSNASGSVVTLADNNTVLGVAITGGATGVAVASSGTVNAGLIGNATTSDVTISGAGGGAFSLGAGNGAFNVNAPITSATGRAVAVTGRTGGTVAFSGAINDTGTGISLTTNSGGAINFSNAAVNLNTGANPALTFTNTAATGAAVTFSGGNLNIDTTSGAGINATSTTIGAGSLTISGANNVIDTTASGARAVILDGITSNATFLHVNAAATNGTVILVKNNGASGSFSITGSGTTANSGGVLNGVTGTDGQIASGIGIYLENANNVSLANLTFTGTYQNFGIRGENVNNFTLNDSNLTGTFGTNGAIGTDEGTIRFGTQTSSTNGLIGTALFNGNTIQGSVKDNVAIFDNGAGSLNVTFQDSAAHQAVIGTTQVGAGNTGIQILTAGTGNANGDQGSGFNLTALVNGVQFNGARGDMVFIEALQKTTQSITVTNNTFIDGQSDRLGGGVNINSSSTADTKYNVTFNISNNTFTGCVTSPIVTYYKGLNGSISGVINSNTIGNPGDAITDSSGSSQGDGMIVALEKNPGAGILNFAVRISNNQIADLFQSNGGITFRSSNAGSGTQLLQATVSGTNTIKQMGLQALSAIYAQIGGQGAGDVGVLGLDLKNATLNVSGTQALAVIDLDQVQPTSHYNFPGYAGPTGGGAANTPLANFWKDATHLNIFTVGASGAGNVFADQTSGITGAAFTLPVPLMLGQGGIEAAAGQRKIESVGIGMSPASCHDAGIPGCAEKSDNGARKNIDSSTAEVGPVAVSQQELDATVSAAIRRWGATGLNPGQLARLRRLTFEVTNLPGQRLGEIESERIRVDNDGGGNGWYIGETDVAFAGKGTRRYTTTSNAPAGRIDLLTAIMHEMGHALGLPDTYAEQDRDSVMYGFLTKGERRLPAKNQAGGIMPNEKSGPHFLASPVNIGTLPPGKTVKIVYSVTVGPITGNPQSISSQGSVTSNIATVLTSDAVAGSGPTVTLLGIAPAFTSANATTFTVGTAGNFSVTANGAPAPTFSFTGSLPSGVTLSAAGVLSGTPAAGTGGTYPITITANNGIAPNGTQSFTLTVNQPPAITSANATTFVVGTNGSFTVTKTGFPAPTLSVTGTLPSGVSFTPATGVLSGTPAAGTGGSYPISFKAANGVGSDAVQSFTLTVNQAPAITSANTTTFTAGTPGTFNVIATGFPSPAINLTNGTLPSGVNFGTGTLAGTPTVYGTFPLQFTASNGVGSNAVQSFTLVVNPSASAVKSGGNIAKDPGGYKINFLGNPGTQYTVQFSPSLTSPNWQTLDLKIADPQGTFFSIDNPPAGTTPRFYRAVIP